MTRASVKVDEQIIGEIDRGLLVLVGITHMDDNLDADYLVEKIVNMRIFEDVDGKMNLSLIDIEGGLLAVSQFTLYGDMRHGRRPSFIQAMPGEGSLPIYDHFVAKAREVFPKLAVGQFVAHMDIDLVNDGPVTINLDSEKTF